MAEKWKAIGRHLEKTAQGVLLFLCICIFCGLAYYSTRYTMLESTVDTKDSVGLNLLVLAAITAAAVLLHGMMRNSHLRFVRKRILAWKPYIIGIVSLYVFWRHGEWGG